MTDDYDEQEDMRRAYDVLTEHKRREWVEQQKAREAEIPDCESEINP